jgi:hypothetical protein
MITTVPAAVAAAGAAMPAAVWSVGPLAGGAVERVVVALEGPAILGFAPGGSWALRAVERGGSSSSGVAMCCGKAVGIMA